MHVVAKDRVANIYLGVFGDSLFSSKKVKFFWGHMAHRVVLISLSLALSHTPA